jgi:hypothetical protein
MRSYEREARVAKHVLLAVAVADLEHFPLDLVPVEAPVRDPAALQAQLREALAAELGRHRAGIHTLLFSAEHIHSRLDSPAAVSRLATLLEPWVDECTVLVTLRPQVEMAVSLANLVVRRSGGSPRLIPIFDDPNDYDRILGVRPGYFELDDMLRRFEAAFGAHAIRPVLHAPGSGFDSRQAVFDAVGVRVPHDLPAVRINASLSRDALQVMRSVHAHIDLLGNAGWRPGFIDEVDRRLVRGYAGQGLRPARREAAAFMARYADSNERIRARYFPQRAALFDAGLDAYPDEAQTLEDVPPWLRPLVDVLVQTWID